VVTDVRGGGRRSGAAREGRKVNGLGNFTQVGNSEGHKKKDEPRGARALSLVLPRRVWARAGREAGGKRKLSEAGGPARSEECHSES